jgi:hypothetical protein
VVDARPAAWIDAITGLVSDPDRARSRGAEMRRWVLADGMLSGTLHHWSRALDPVR